MTICCEASTEYSWFSYNEERRELRRSSGGSSRSSSLVNQNRYDACEDEDAPIEDCVVDVYYEDKSDTTKTWIVMGIVVALMILCIICFCVY